MATDPQSTHKESPSNPLLLIVAFMLPLVFVGVVLLSSYIPSSALNTNYDFVYVTCKWANNSYVYNCSNYLELKYDVVDGELVETEVPDNIDSDNDGVPDNPEAYRLRLFIHDVTEDVSREITMEQAQAMRLNGLITSPDGISVEWNYNSYRGFPFLFRSSNQGFYLTRGDARKRLSLIDSDTNYWYRDGLHILGWVME